MVSYKFSKLLRLRYNPEFFHTISYSFLENFREVV